MGDLHYIKAAISLKKEFDLDNDRNTFVYVWILFFNDFIQEILHIGRVNFLSIFGFLLVIHSKHVLMVEMTSSQEFLLIVKSVLSKISFVSC